MVINKNAKTKEEIIPFLLKVGFKLITDNERIPTPHYVYEDETSIIKLEFNTIGLNGGSLIHIILFDNDDNYIQAFIEKHAIEYLNSYFKYKLRKIKIDNLLNGNN